MLAPLHDEEVDMKRILVGVSAAAAIALPAVAGAQQQNQSSPPGAERTWLQRPVGAPEKALELNVGTGYTQPFGELSDGVGFPSVANAGVGVEVGAGYRIDPRIGVNISGQYQELEADRGTGTRGLSGTVAVQYHFKPDSRIDPWAELGAGYRALWQTFGNNQDTIVSPGLQAARARVGADLRVSQDVALGPFVGADANVFLFQDGSAIDSPRISTFVQAGLQGRFDIGGTRTFPSDRGPRVAKR
jgi:opacity protein-like surface antigen